MLDLKDIDFRLMEIDKQLERADRRGQDLPGDVSGALPYCAADFPRNPAGRADPALVPVDEALPIEAHFFVAKRAPARRALIIGGFHGDENPGFQLADAFVEERRDRNRNQASEPLEFHTLVIPRLNRGAVEDNLAGRAWKLACHRCNRQGVDLNRNFPVVGQEPGDTSWCPNTVGAPTQPEVTAVMHAVAFFKPDRILSLHSISTPANAGVFADPNQEPEAVLLARRLAALIPHESDRPYNRLGPDEATFNAVYPGDKPGVVGGGTSLGAWGPFAQRGKRVPVITLEVPGHHPLDQGVGPRTFDSFLRVLRGFVTLL